MEIVLQTGSRQPIWRQLAEQIREGVAQGRLLPGEQLPSVRDLARKLVINPNTVARVYLELERDGVLVTRPGVGVFVAPPRDELRDAVRRQRLAEAVDRLLTEAVLLGFSEAELMAMVEERLASYRWPKVG